MTAPATLRRAGTALAAAPAWQTFLVVFLPILGVYLATMGKIEPQSNYDAVSAALPAWRFAQFGDLDLSAFEQLPQITEINGRIMSNRPPGIAFISVPAYWVFGQAGYTGVVPSLLPATATAAVLSAGAVGVLHLVFRRLTSAGAAVAAAYVFGLGTSVWSIASGELWPHGPGMFFLALAVLALSANRFLAAGFAYGAALLIRPLTGLIAALTGLAIAWRRRSWRPALLVGLGSACGLLGLVAYNGLIIGEWSLAPAVYGQTFLDRAQSHRLFAYLGDILGSLFVPEYGLFVFSPFLLFTIPGLRRAWDHAEPWVRASAVAGLVYILIHLRLNRYWGGYALNYRYQLEMLAVTAPLLFLSWQVWYERAKPFWRRMFWYAFILSVLAQVLSLYVETTPRVLNAFLQ
jgi:hypothetical protein